MFMFYIKHDRLGFTTFTNTERKLKIKEVEIGEKEF